MQESLLLVAIPLLGILLVVLFLLGLLFLLLFVAGFFVCLFCFEFACFFVVVCFMFLVFLLGLHTGLRTGPLLVLLWLSIIDSLAR